MIPFRDNQEPLCIHKKRMLLRGRRWFIRVSYIAIRYKVNINVTGFLLVIYE